MFEAIQAKRAQEGSLLITVRLILPESVFSVMQVVYSAERARHLLSLKMMSDEEL